MSGQVRLNTSCPKCGFSAYGNASAWGGPRYILVADISTFEKQRFLDHLEFTCEGCGFKTQVPCLDAK